MHKLRLCGFFYRSVTRTWVAGLSLPLLTFVLAACARPELPKAWPFLFGSERPIQDTQTLTHTLRFLAWQGTDNENDFIIQTLTRFAQANPATQIEYHLVDNYRDTLLAELDRPLPPDVFFVSGASLSYLTDQRLLGAVPALQTQGVILPDHLAGAYQRFGTAYCRPRETFPFAVLYNKASFDKAGLAYPRPDWQWSEFIDLATTLTDINTGQHGLVLPVELSRLVTFALQAGVTVPAGPLRFSDMDRQALVTAIEFYLSLFADRAAVEPADLNSIWTGDALGRSGVAMTIEASWILPYLRREYPELEYAIAPLPAGPIANTSIVFTSCAAVHASSQPAAAAHGLAAFLSTPEHMLDWGRLTGSLPPQADLHQAWLASFPAAAAYVSALDNPAIWQWDAEEVAPYNTLLHTAVNDSWTAEELYTRLVEVAPVP